MQNEKCKVKNLKLKHPRPSVSFGTLGAAASLRGELRVNPRPSKNAKF
jgi:hypothetical protein